MSFSLLHASRLLADSRTSATPVCAQVDLETYLGKHAEEIIAAFVALEQPSEMPCFCGTENAYRCPAHINPVDTSRTRGRT